MITVKRFIGGIASAFYPQCRFDRALFVIGHMRCGSTALSNILCSRPDISGYGEAHIAYASQADLGVLIVNQRKRGAWKPEAHYLFDKILHSRYDERAPQDFFDAKAIFIGRKPAPAISSIRTLFQKIGSAEYQKTGEAEGYYEARLIAMTALWQNFPAKNRVGITYEALVADPDLILSHITKRLQIDPPLANHYSANDAAARPGAGDPLVATRETKIVPMNSEHDEGSALPQSVISAHAEFVRAIA